jgi:hypothetical protein
MSKVIIAGSRTFNDYTLLEETLNKFNLTITEIVSGTAKGADSLGERYATENNITIKKFPANWAKYNKSAGYIRNKEMAEYGDILIAFWDGKSKGTKHMIDLANNKNLSVNIIEY